MTRIAERLVVGCGYLGERVARRWLTAGDRVVAVTRRPARAAELRSLGIDAVVADVTASDPGWPRAAAAPAGFSTVFWAVGFDRSAAAAPRDVHVTGLARLLDSLHGAPRVILSSSTGVWGDEAGDVVCEDTPVHPRREAGRVLLEAEATLHGHRHGPGTTLRFAGLYGPRRLPRLDDLRAGRPLAVDPDSWLNLVHVDDAAAVVCAVAAAEAPGSLYVVSDGRPIRRREWYGRLADLAGTPPPIWNPAASRARGGDKRVDPSRLFRDVAVRLTHPDALAALGGLVAG